MADSTIPGLSAIAAALAAADLVSVRRIGQTRNEKAAITDLAAAFAAGGPAPLTGYGTVTSVGLSLTGLGWLSVGGSPVTGAGTLSVTRTSQAQNQVLATPSSGAGVVGLRALAAADLPLATGAALGAVQLAGDLGGTATSPLVAALQGVALSGTPSAGQVLTATGPAAATWQAAAGGGLSNPLAAGSLGAASLQLVAAGDGLWQELAHTVDIQANGLRVARFESSASAVTFFDFLSSAAGGGDVGPKITATSSGATADFLLDTKGLTSRYDFRVNGNTYMDLNAAGDGSLRIQGGSGNNLTLGGSVHAGSAIDFNADSGINRVAGKVVGFSSGGGSSGGWFNYAGTSHVAADLTNATATLTNITGLSAPLIAGRFYFVRMVVKCVNSVAAEGMQFDFGGGTATATLFWVGAGIFASGGTDVIGSNISTSLTGAITFSTFTGESVILFEGYIQCNAAGTLIPRFAENSHTTGTATVRAGTCMTLVDSP